MNVHRHAKYLFLIREGRAYLHLYMIPLHLSSCSVIGPFLWKTFPEQRPEIPMSVPVSLNLLYPLWCGHEHTKEDGI